MTSFHDEWAPDDPTTDKLIQNGPATPALNSLGISRFDRTGGLPDNIDQVIKDQQHALQFTPDGHADKPALYNNLGISFFRRSQLEETGHLDDIFEAIKLYRHAIQHTPDGHANMLNYLQNLGSALTIRFQRFGELDDIFEAIKCQQHAIQLAPDGHANMPVYLLNLGRAFMHRFRCMGDLDDISEAIKYLQDSVQLTPDGHTQMPFRLHFLGSLFSTRFERTKNLDDIAEAINYQRRAIQLTPDADANLPDYLENLGTSLSRRFDRTGDLHDITPDGHDNMRARLNSLWLSCLTRFQCTGDMDNLSEAIKCQQRALQVTPDGHAVKSALYNNLGISFFHRSQRTGHLDDISEAMENFQLAIQYAPAGDVNMSNYLLGLGNAFTLRFQRLGNLDDISEAIKYQQRAIQLTSDGHANLLNSLGTSLLCRFERSGDPDDISKAIQTFQSVVQLTPDEHASMPGHLSNLGSSFSIRFDHTGDLNDITQAIECQQRATQLSPDGHADLPGYFLNLGISFLSRFERTRDLRDISQAIRCQQRTIQLTPDGHANLPSRLDSLGCSFESRYKFTGDLDDAAEGIKYHQYAVQLVPEGHANLPTWLNNLGISFLHRFQHTGDLNDLIEAIKHQERTVRLTPTGSTSMPGHLSNLGISLFRRFERTRDLDDISEAIKLQLRAIQFTPKGHVNLPGYLQNLGNSFEHRFRRTGALDDISEAIKNLQCAIDLTPGGHPDMPSRLSNLGIAFSSHFDRSGNLEFLEKAASNFRRAATYSTGPPSIRLLAANQWVELSRRSPSLSTQRLDSHACTMQLLSLVSGLENTVKRRHETLVKSSRLSNAASAAALALGHAEKALEWLIEGRCIVWNQINQLRTPVDALRAHNQALADRFSLVSRELEMAGSRTGNSETSHSLKDKISLEEQAGQHIKLAKEWDELLVAIRNIPGFKDFVRPKKCSDILRDLPDEGIIIIINIHDDRCDALALMGAADKPMHIPLSKFSYEEAERLSKGLYDHLLRHGVISRKGVPLSDPDDAPLPGVDLAEVLGVLWTRLVWPILESIALSVPDTESRAELPHIWWCPTGPLSFLPIHAAGIYVRGKGKPNQCLSEFAVSSYIPTVNALFKSPTPNSAEKPGDAPAGLLIVSQPNTPNKTPIPYAAEETKRISKQFENGHIPCMTLGDESGTVEGVLKAMGSFPSVHLACHASQNLTNPLKSSIYLHDGPLELSEIMKQHLSNSDFAFLSACQTSTGDKNLPDEVVHLAAGMLAAGYRSVVGTMWSIFDAHGGDMAEFFYESLLDGVKTKELSNLKTDARAARALHRATQRLREQISDSLLIWVPYIHIGV